MPLFEALQFVSKTLGIYGLSKETKIIAAAKIYTAFDVLKLRALGADAISMRNRFTCSDKPYEKDGHLSNAFVLQVMERFRSDILNSTMNIIRSWGYTHIKDITLSSFFRSLDTLQSKKSDNDYDHEERDINEKRNYRLSQKRFAEIIPVQKFF